MTQHDCARGVKTKLDLRARAPVHVVHIIYIYVIRILDGAHNKRCTRAVEGMERARERAIYRCNLLSGGLLRDVSRA